MRDVTAAIARSVVETTHQPGLFSSTTLSRPQANFLLAGLVKHLSLYWTHLRVNGIWATSFCPEKQVAQLSQRDRAAGWVSNGQKWKTGTERQYLRAI